MILCGGSDSGEWKSPEHDFKYLYWKISKKLSPNLFTSKGTYMTDWVGRISIWKKILWFLFLYGKIHSKFLVRIVKHTTTYLHTLHHTATHCNTLQHTATHCNTHAKMVILFLYWKICSKFLVRYVIYIQYACCMTFHINKTKKSEFNF